MHPGRRRGIRPQQQVPLAAATGPPGMYLADAGWPLSEHSGAPRAWDWLNTHGGGAPERPTANQHRSGIRPKVNAGQRLAGRALVMKENVKMKRFCIWSLGRRTGGISSPAGGTGLWPLWWRWWLLGIPLSASRSSHTARTTGELQAFAWPATRRGLALSCWGTHRSASLQISPVGKCQESGLSYIIEQIRSNLGSLVSSVRFPWNGPSINLGSAVSQ